MKLDFDEFLNGCEQTCKTLDDFKNRVTGEQRYVSEEFRGNNLEKQYYLRNLENITHCLKTSAMREATNYNDRIRRIINKFNK